MRQLKRLIFLIIYPFLVFSISAHAFFGMNIGSYNQGTKPWWTKIIAPNATAGTGETNVRGSAIDASGNIYATGWTTGSVDGNALTGYYDLVLIKYDSTGTKQWTKQLGVATSDTSGMAVCLDSSGNIYVGGITNGDFEGLTAITNYNLFIAKFDSTGTKQWTKQLGVPSVDTIVYGIVSDSSGDVYVTGFSEGGLDGNTLTGTSDLIFVKYDSNGNKQWTRQMGVSGKQTRAHAIAIDSSNNIFIAGMTSGGLDGNTLAGMNDFFLTKYNTSGVKQWTRQLGVSSKSTEARGVATDSSGNIYVTGFTNGGLDGNTKMGASDNFITKYNSSGVKQWTKQRGVTGIDTSSYAIAVDNNGDPFIGGGTWGGLDGNTVTGSTDIYITKYNSAGTRQWTKQLGTAMQQASVWGLVTSSSGDVYGLGDTGAGFDGNAAIGGQDGFIIKYNSSGTKQWSKEFGAATGPSNVEGKAIAVDSSSNVYIAGDSTGGVDGITLTGSGDFYLMKFNSAGAKQWTRQLGVAGASTWGKAVAIDSADNIHITGETTGGLDGNTLSGAGATDFFVTKYNSAGTKQWTKQLGKSGGYTVPYAIATDSSSNVFIVGSTNGNLDGITKTGSVDFFLTKYNSAGTKQWTKLLGVASKLTIAKGVKVDSSGNIYVTGTTTGGLDGNTLSGSGSTDLFLTKYNSAGTKQWTKQLGNSGTVTVGGLALDSSANIYITGGTYGDFDGNLIVGYPEIYLTKYNSAGTKQWTKTFGFTDFSAYGTSIAINSLQEVYLYGSVSGGSTGSFDGYMVANPVYGWTDMLLMKVNSSGKKIWTKGMGVTKCLGNCDTAGTGVAVDTLGNVFLSGTTGGGLDFNSFSGYSDAFVMKYGGN